MALVWSEITEQVRRSIEAALERKHAGEDGGVPEARKRPTVDTVENLTKHYTHVDAPSWDAVKARYIEGHPENQAMREDIRRNGIREPIKVDYDQSPPQVVDGHTRLWHAEALGMHEVPVKHSTYGEAHYGDNWLGF